MEGEILEIEGLTELNEKSGFDELEKIEKELKDIFFGTTTTCCASGTCS